MKARGTLIILLLLAFPASAADPPMICFGNEPSWGLHFADAGNARLQLPDAPPVEYRGSATRLDVIHERAWRGKPATGGSGDLVAFLRDAACSDGMSDTKHPVIARVSLADGRFLAGCCRIASAPTAAPVATTSIEGPTWRLTDLRGLDPRVLRDATRPVTAGIKAGRISGFSGCNQFFGPYILDRDERHVNIRAFSDKMKREAYERQKRVCPKCKKTFDLSEMEADHIKPWREGGKTNAANCQMLCKDDNRRKSGR